MSNIEDVLNILMSGDNNGEKSTENVESNTDGGDMFGNIDIESVLKIGEIMSKLNEPDKNTELLIALKPHLREENRAKIDTAVKLFRLISLLPYLRDSGLFEKLF
ncbi:MAG: hypothetical protein J1E39_07705 [Eubacterium sp.]|nr:hypothetical protein [Eubacterium sp.]